MKTSLLKISLFLILTNAFLTGCDKTKEEVNIVYHSVNKEYVLIKDVQTLQESNDAISTHVDSILTGLIEADFVSTGQKEFDLDADEFADIGFEIIDLNQFNPSGLSTSFDSLAARVTPKSIEILDNSTYSYPDALDFDDVISDSGNWTIKTGVLGTFMNAGQFQGKGVKYLGIRLVNQNNFKYGWVKIYCSQHNDTLKIIDFAYNDSENSHIKAGQVK